MFQPTSPQNEAIVKKLADALALLPAGETIAYSALVKAAPGFRAKNDLWLLSKARENTEKSMGCAFESVRGVGVKRLASADIPDIGLAALRRIRRAANRGQRRLKRVNSNSLSAQEQRRVVGMTAMLGAVALVADGRRATAIAAVADPVKPIPPQNILDMFRVEA